MTLMSRSPLLLDHSSRQFHKSYAAANMAYLQERVLILRHYFTSKFFAAVHKTFRSAYTEKQVPNKIIH